MKRRQFLVVGAGLLAGHAFGQPAKPPKIGIISPAPLGQSPWAEGIVKGLAEVGYRDGAGIKIEYRVLDFDSEGLSKVARDLIAAKCDLVFAFGPEGPVRALQDARAPMPIVLIAVDFDPIEKGIIADLRRPDRNTTGLYVPQNALVAKRFEILREAVPKARNFLVMADVHSAGQVSAARAAEASGVRMTLVEFTRAPYDFSAAFEAGRRARVDGLVQLASPEFFAKREELAALLIKHRLPAIGTSTGQAVAGYLMSLAPDIGKTTRRAAQMAAKILKGGKTTEMPVEQVDEFELVINVKTAWALGTKIPESVLVRATRIIS